MVVLDEIWREHWGRLLGMLLRRYRRADLVEDALAEAFAMAAEQWPGSGVPTNPVGWLHEVARRRVVDAVRRETTAEAKSVLIATGMAAARDRDEEVPGAEVDERLALLFMATHPALKADVRAALALRFVLGVSTEEIAALFLVPTATMAARLTRAKSRLATAGIPFAVPDLDRWPERVDDVARAIYLAFTTGYAPFGGDDVVRIRTAGEAVRLALLAADLLPDAPVLDALAALLLLQHARRNARTDSDGLVLLADQDRRLWHQAEIDAALTRLAALSPVHGYAEELRLQALIAAFHCTATSTEATDWRSIARTYARLETLTGSPIVRLNRAVAIAEYAGPEAGLALLETIDLPGHHRPALVRAELRRRQGKVSAAVTAYTMALELCPEGAERTHIAGRLAGLNEGTD